MKPTLELVAVWGAVVAALAVGAHEARAIVSPIESITAVDTVTYADKRIVYTVGTDTATVNGQLRRLPILTDAPAGARFRAFWKTPLYDSVMLLTGDTFSMSPTDSATVTARAKAWGVPDPFVITLVWHDSAGGPAPLPDPVTNFALVMANDTLVASWTETADTYQVMGGLETLGSGEDYTDTVGGIGTNKQVVATFGNYWTCTRTLIATLLSDSRCNNVNYDSVGGEPPPSANDPVFVENFEGFTTTTWRAQDRNPYAVIAPNDHFIETTGSPEGSNHLRLFRAAKSTSAGCVNNTVGWEVENNGTAAQTGAEGFGNIMQSATEVWIEFYVKFDSSGSAPWGTLPDPAWGCSGNPYHKLLRVHSLPVHNPDYIGMKDGTSAGPLWRNSIIPNFEQHPNGSGDMLSATQDWDDTWHLIRIHAKRSSSGGVADGVIQWTIDRPSGGSRVLLNSLGGHGTYMPSDSIDTWWTGWNYMQVGLNRNHWTNHDAQFRLDNFRIWTNTGNGGPGWVNTTLDDAP